MICFNFYTPPLGNGLRIIIRIELGQAGSLIGDDKVYNVVVTAHAFIIEEKNASPGLRGLVGGYKAGHQPLLHPGFQLVLRQLNLHTCQLDFPVSQTIFGDIEYVYRHIQYLQIQIHTGSASFGVAGSLDPYLKCVSGIKRAKRAPKKKVRNTLS